VAQKADAVEPPAALKTGIPIYPRRAAARKHPIVIYTLYAPRLSSGERVNIAGSDHTSYCRPSDISGNGNPGSPCRMLTGGEAPDPYDYTVHLEIHVYQAESATAKSSGQSEDWLANSSRLCTFHFHHCAFTAKNNVTGLSRGSGKYINLELAAWTSSGEWESGQMLEVEGDCVNDNYGDCVPRPNDDQRTKSKGQLSVIRMGSGYSGTVTAPTQAQFTQAYIDINTSGTQRPQVVYSRPIYGVEQGDVIEAAGGMQLDGTQPCAPDYCTLNGSPDPTYVFHHNVQAWWLLATSPLHKRADSDERYISGADIQNCQSSDGTDAGLCRLQQLGAVTAPAPPDDRTMYLNFVGVAKDTSHEGPSTNGVTPKVQLATGQFDASCNPRVFPDSGSLCRFSP